MAYLMWYIQQPSGRTEEGFTRNSQSHGRDSNPLLPEQKSDLLVFQITCSLIFNKDVTRTVIPKLWLWNILFVREVDVFFG
jgi:hypothetical protein